MERFLKKTLSYGLLAIGCWQLAACAVEDNPIVPEPIEPQKKYAERLVPVTDPRGESQGMVMLRFYEDMPDVAYVSISNFQSIMYPGTTVEVTKTTASQYALTSPCGTAVVDVVNDIFQSDDYEAFTNLMGQVQPGMPSTTFDAMPMLRFKSLEKSPDIVPVRLDYGQYGIDLRADDTDVYFPFMTISDLYSDGYMHIAAFNGQTVIVAPEGAFSLTDGLPASFFTPILTAQRTQDMADYSYRNLCFTLTNFFGYPGRSLLEKSMKEKGLDQALTDYGTAGTMTRDMLKSTNMYNYLSGMTMLGCLLNDGGHTYMNTNNLCNMSGNPSFKTQLEAVMTKEVKEFYTYCPDYQNIVRKVNAMSAMVGDTLRKLRKELLGKDTYYVKRGNTVYCQFNSFMCDFSGWKAFYRDEAQRPTVEQYPDDSLVRLLDALERAEQDQEVDNFIIDISTNGGGSTDVAMLITSLLCDKDHLNYENALTGQKITTSYEVDRNLDGHFDEKDKEVTYRLKVGILVSPFSFSCANLLPSLMKDYGVPIIGQKSGGGSCCVIYTTTAEGFSYNYSTHRMRMHNHQGQNIDVGVEPDYVIAQYADFFDIAKVGQCIENYYKK